MNFTLVKFQKDLDPTNRRSSRSKSYANSKNTSRR